MSLSNTFVPRSVINFHCLVSLSHTSLYLKDELSSANHRGSKSGTPQALRSKSNSSTSPQATTSKSNTYSQSPHDGVSPVPTGSASLTPMFPAASDVATESVDMPTQDQEISEGLSENLDRTSEKPDSNKNITAVHEAQQSHLGHDGGVY